MENDMIVVAKKYIDKQLMWMQHKQSQTNKAEHLAMNGFTIMSLWSRQNE